MPTIQKITKTTSLKKRLQENKISKMIRRQAREEARLNATIRKVAQSVATPMDRTSIYVYTNTKKTISTLALEYKGNLDTIEPEWAPWSSYTRLAQSIKNQRKRQRQF